jgi:hypothetical protein
MESRHLVGEFESPALDEKERYGPTIGRGALSDAKQELEGLMRSR